MGPILFFYWWQDVLNKTGTILNGNVDSSDFFQDTYSILSVQQYVNDAASAFF